MYITSSGTRGEDDDTFQSPSPPDISSKSTSFWQRRANSKSNVSASSMQPPAHLVTNPPPPRNALPYRALRENSSSISLPVVAPGPEETRKRNESPHRHEDSRSRRTVIRPYAEQIDRTASDWPSVEPSTSYYIPPSSSGKRRADAHHPEQNVHSASLQPFARSTTSYPQPLSSIERNVTRPHAEQFDHTSLVRPSAETYNPYITPFSSSETNFIRPDAKQFECASSVQSSAPLTSSLTIFPSSGLEVISPYAEILRRTTPVQSPVDPSSPPLLKQPSTFIPPLSTYSAPELADMSVASSQVHTRSGMLSYTPQALSREASSESQQPPSADRRWVRPDQQSPKEPPPPSADRRWVRPDQQSPKDPPATSHRPPVFPEPVATEYRSLQGDTGSSAAPHHLPVPPEHTPATTGVPSRAGHKDSFAAPQKSRVPLKQTHATTKLPSRARHKDASAAPPPVPPKQTPAAIELRSSQDQNSFSAAQHRPPTPLGRTPATTASPPQDRKDASDALTSSEGKSGCSLSIACPCCGIQCAYCDTDCVCCGTTFACCCIIC